MDDDPGPSVAHYFNQDKATENFYRLSQLIMTVCTDLFRDILSRHIKPGELRFELDKNKKKLENIMNFQQRQLIYPILGNTSLVIKDLDFSVLYIILRNICKISPHLSGWGNNPLPSDKSIAACIDRIRQLRNLISGHSTNGRVEEIEFKNHWTELRNAVVEIEKQSVGGDLYERGVDYLLNCDLPHVRLNTCDNVKDPPNVIMGHDTSLDTNAVRLIAKVFPSDKTSVIEKVFWTKNGVGIDIQRMGRKYSKISTGNPSLTINNVNQQDAGSYQLIAVNSVGSTVSDTVILDVPKIFLEINELKEDRSKRFKVTIQSIPAPMYAQWKIKEKNDDAFELLDVNAEEYRGSQNSLPHPVLFVKHTEHLKTQIFQIEVHNFIGSSRRIITADMPPVILETEKLAVGLETFYDEKGASIRFSNLFHDLAENVPWRKTEQLKDLIQNSCKLEDVLSLKQASSPRDCFRILKDAKLFTSADVIFIQYLLKKMNCTELFEKCCEYAEAQKALCFYEKPPENGFKNVQFHVRGNLSEYSPIQIEKIKETVAVIAGCSSKEIHVGGFLPSTSFLVVLSLKEIYLEKLFNMDQWKKDRLVEVNVDYFIVDLKIIYVDSSKGMGWNLYFDPMVRNPSKTENKPTKNLEFQNQEEASSIQHRFINLPNLTLLEYGYDSDDSGSCSICSDSGVLRASLSGTFISDFSYSDEEIKIKTNSGLPQGSLSRTSFSDVSCSDEETKMKTINKSLNVLQRRLRRHKKTQNVYHISSNEETNTSVFIDDFFVPPNPAFLTSSFAVPNMSSINHIAYVKPGRLWVSGIDTLMQIDLDGNNIENVDDAICCPGGFAVTEIGDLFYIGKDKHSIKKKSAAKTSTIVDLANYEYICCICISKKKGDLLVVIRDELQTIRHRVVRYDTERNIHDIVLDGIERGLYLYPMYITENRNGDIIVSDHGKQAVVVVNSAGQERFTIRKRNSVLLPCGVATDDYGNIHVVEYSETNYIYVFDQDGFLSLLLDNKEDSFWGLCLDDERNLYVGNADGTIDVYIY